MADQDDDIDLAEAELDDLFDDEYSSAELVPIEVDTEEVLSDPRRSDVDRWGRSERTRQWARRLYDPLYRYWFRTELEGLENLPGAGALLVANHAGAVPPDAAVLMHGIETETSRPVYGLAEFLFH